VDAELGEDVLEVPPHSPGREPQRLGDLGVRPALGDEIEDLLLARREAGREPALLEQQRPVDEVDRERSLSQSRTSGSPNGTFRRSLSQARQK
jgi:hypothetical protein